ncbi:DUF4998 domain-containing protein [Parapedobacter composti]|nr:DUF4998 domain-containing protein [Parapedobacter composti]
MKNITMIDRIKQLTVLLLVAAGTLACSKMDEYKKYVADGEISYTGKLDSLKIYSGRNRVLVQGVLRSDPKVKECRIYWNGRNDSVSVPITRTQSVDTLRVLIENMEENVHNFEVVTFDDVGNKSITVFGTGIVYGARFQNSLLNRPINFYELFAGDLSLTLNYGRMDLTSGAFATEIQYEDQQGLSHEYMLSIDENDLILENYQVGSSFRYRTKFLPDTLCLDTFYTAFTEIAPNVVYFKNMTFPYQRGAWDGSRWGVPADWVTNAQVRNAGNNTYGGYELRNGNGVLSLEGGWGLRAVVDGKIMQTSNLPPGDYRITIYGIERGAAGSVHFAVAEGTELPNEQNLATQAITYVNCAASGTYSVDFSLTEITQVTVGFIGNMPDTGSWFKVAGNVVFEVL